MENITVFARSASIQASAKLVIKDFVHVMSSSIPGKYYESKRFMVGDTPMAIRVIPREDLEGNKGHMFTCGTRARLA